MAATTPTVPGARKEVPHSWRKQHSSRQLRHYLYRKVASELAHHAGNGSEWLFPKELSELEHTVLVEELNRLVTDFDVKANKLLDKLTKYGEEPIK